MARIVSAAIKTSHAACHRAMAYCVLCLFLIELCLSITSNEVELRARDRVVGGGRVVVRERAG